MARKIPQNHTVPKTPNPRSKTKSETTISATDRPEHVAKPSVTRLDNAEPDEPKIGKAEYTLFDDVTADRVVEAIEQLHTIRGVAIALNIPRKTIYDWMHKYPDFKERVETAQRQYYRSQDAENIASMRKNLKDICENGWIVQRKTKKQMLDKRGEIVELVTEEITKAPPPDWAFQRVLGGSDETQAIKTLATAGWIPDEIAMEIMEKLEGTSGDVKDIFRKRFNLEDL